MAQKVPTLLLSSLKMADVPSTPRRRLANALEAARELQIESIQNVKEMEDGLQTGRVDREEKVVSRFGKKLSGKYVLVTAYYKKPNLRFVVYVSESSSKYELTCVHKDISDKETHDLDPDLIKMVAHGLGFDATGRLMFGPDVPAIWKSD
eukprot:INCI7306.1.p2 GENE.INCI7306.1~~INCI7306.1.p2  ORF type:complete len:150 (-),score=29.23 INCI7306.1:263-712(-)